MSVTGIFTILPVLALAALVQISCGQAGDRLGDNSDLEADQGTVTRSITLPPSFESADQDRDAYRDLYPEASLDDLTAEYFIEMFLYKGEDQQMTPTQHMTQQPKVWLDPRWRQTSMGRAIEEVTVQVIDEMTGGVLKASPSTDDQPPTTSYIIFRLSETLSGGSCSADRLPSDPNSAASLEGGTIWCSPEFLEQVEPYFLVTLIRHELGHILANTVHSGMIGTIMSYNGVGSQFPQFELNAWRLLYQLPTHQSFDDMVGAGYFSPSQLSPKPTIAYTELIDPHPLYRRNGQIRSEVERLAFSKNMGASGFKISLRGNRHFFPWGCHSRNISYPVVTISGKTAVVEPLDLPERVFSSENPYAYYNPCPGLIVTVPDDIDSGPLVVTTIHGSSYPLDFEIFDAAELPDY